ncbi:PHD-finger protein (macronuclear) [Tetrahymena thermophila SB210]|uniref:PHD-finger protein n=1 Tax=Tetrahymena thermophila (strain SB210) TaxID=312017 RepID=Q24DG1_TETTS|nr:PHD-finger protein [Tetrahymena thermophila SB210]EAS05817.2 PHD-finger protein [Tetrahymena thermophila SB210]|eukprot:XP_001026062.2 PHD-finger protein [Tetrahymena thermophila SB210]
MNWSQKLSKKKKQINKQQKEEEKQYQIDFNKYKKINRNSLLKNQIKQRKIYIDCYIDYTYLQRIHKQIMEEEKQIDNNQKLEESNFKVKFTRLSNYQDYQESYCEVCFQSNNKYYPENDEKGIKMMVCYGCSLKCHAYCYGIDTQTQEELIKKKQDQKVLYFLCQKCRIEPKKPIGCVICNQKKGALKKIENSQTNEWVHITCGFYNKGIVKIDNYRTMAFVKQSDAPIEKDKKAKKSCHFCKSDVGIERCVTDGCQQHAHVYCIMNYVREKEKAGADPLDIKWFARMNYVNNVKFDISKGENETSNLSKNVYFQQSMKHSFNEISQILLGEPIYQLENAASFESAEIVPAEQKQSKISSAKKKGKRKLSEDETQDQNQENTNFIEETQQATKITKQNKIEYQSKLVELGNLVMKNFVLNATTASSIQEEQVVAAAKMNSSALKKSAKNDKIQNSDKATQDSQNSDPEIYLRGGEMYIECPDHRRIDVYCVCQKADASDDMVYCDLCNDWYHYSCVKYNPDKDDDSSGKYRCTMCEDWYNHKKKKLLKEFQSGKAETTNILIANMPKFNLMDFISVIMITDQRIQNLLFNQKKGNIDSQINEAVKFLSYFPLFSSKIQEITVFKQRKYLHQAVNDFLQKIIEETELLKIVSAVQIDEKSPAKYIVLEENLKKNEELKRLIDGISALFQRNKTKEKGILLNLKKPINWILKVHQVFFKKQEKISSLILQELMKDEEDDVKNTVEYQLLDQYAQRLKSWNAKVNSFYENIIQKANSKMEEEKQSAENTEKKQVEEDEFINLKYQLWRDRLSTRPTIEELEQILEEGREIPVDCSQDIKKLESEKDEVQIWFQTLDERERSANLLLTQKLKQEERINKSSHIAQNDQDGESKIKKENNTQSISKASLQEEQAQEQQMNNQNGEKIQVEEEQNQQQKQENSEDPKINEEKSNEKNENQNEAGVKDQMDNEENEQNQKGEQKQQEKMNEENNNAKDQQNTAMEIEKNSEKTDKKGEEHKENHHKQEQESQAEGGKGHVDNLTHQKIYKNQQLMSKGDFEIFANQMFTKVVLQVPRMNQIIDMLQQYEVNELQWERLLEFINEKEQENNAKKQQQELEQNQQQDEFIQQQIILSQYQNNTSKYELIEFQELKDLLESCLKLEIKVPFLNQIVQQMNNYLEQKAQFQNVLNSQFDESNYFQQLKKILTLPFIFEEEKQFYERIVYFKEIQEICKSGFKKFYSVEQIQKLSEICQSSKFSEEITSEFQSKTENICQIAKGLNKIVETGLIEKEQLDQAKELTEQISQMKNSKVDFKRELEILKSIQKSVQWFRSLHKFFFNLNEDQIKLDPSMRVQEIDLEIEDMLEAKNIDECEADIQEKWNLVCQNLNQVKGELYSFIKEGISTEYHHDKRISKIYQNLCEMCWIYEAKLLLSLQDVKFQQVFEMLQTGLNFKINQENEIFKKVKELLESTKKKHEEEMQLRQQHIQEMQKQQQEQLKFQQLQQQQQSLQSKKINLVVSDDSGNENGSQKSDWDKDEDDEEDGQDEEDEDEDEEDEEDDDEDDDDDDDEDEDDNDDDSKTDKDGRDDNNDDDGNGRNNNNQKGNQKKTDLIQIESDLSLMDEEESQQQQQQNESDTNNLNEVQRNQYKTLFEQGLKWKNEVQSAYQIIKNCSSSDSGENNNKMDIEKLSDDSLVTFQQLKNLLQEGYQITQDILKLHQSVVFMKSKMIKLENIFISIHKHLDQFNKIKNPDLVDDSVKIQNCIDISDILIEYKVNLSSNSQEKLSFKNMIKFPFRNLNKFASNYKREEDLSYFIKETTNESSKQIQATSSQQGSKQSRKQQAKLQEQKQRKQKGNVKQSQVIELESQENNQETNNNDSKSEKSGQQVTGLRQKSTRNKTKLIDSDYVYFTKHQTKEETVAAENKQKQKAKQNNKQVSENSKKVAESQEENSEDEGDDDHDSANLEQKAKPEQVSDGDRSKTLENLKKTFMQNEVFSKCLNNIKAIENQLFGELNKDRKKYLIKAQQFTNLFSKLSAYPQISKKLVSKGLQMSSLEKLMNQQDSRLEAIEKQINNQQVQQQESSSAAQNNPKSTQPSSNNKNAQSANLSNNNYNQTSRNSSQQSAQASSQLQKNLNSTKEPQLQKKIKQFDPLPSIPGITSGNNASSQNAQQSSSSSHNSNSVLSMLIQKNDSSKSNNNTNSGNNNTNNNNNSNSNNNNNNNRQKDNNKYNSNSVNNSQNSFQNKFKEDQQNKKNNQNYQQTNNRKRRNQQANFSDESENEEIQSKNVAQQELSKDLYKGRNQSLSFDDDIKINKKSTFIDFENKKQEQKQQSPQSFSQSHQSTNEDKQTPKSSINKQDDENIEQIQNIFNSESKLYTFDKASNSNQQSQGTELLYNPDEEEEGVQGGEVEMDIQKINQQYFDFDYDQNPAGTLSETNQNNSNNSNNKVNNNQQNNSSINYQNDAEKDNLYQKNSSSLKQKSDSFTNKEAYQNQMEEELDVPIPEDSIVRICSSSIKPQKNMDSIKIYMHTLEPIKKLNQFPLTQLIQNLEVKCAYTGFDDVNSYISTYTSRSKSKPQLMVMKGWIEVQNPKKDSENFLQLIKQQDEKKKVLGYKIGSVFFNVFTESQIKKTDYKFDIKPFNSDNAAVQYFVITKKMSEPKPDEPNNYEFVKFCTNLNPPNSLQGISPIISDNEDDENIMSKRDSIFDDKYNEDSQQDLKLDIIDFNQIQQQIQELPTADVPQPSLDDKQPSFDHLSQPHSYQAHGHHQQQPYQGQYNSYQRQQPPPPPIPQINQQGFPSNIPIVPPSQMPFNHSNQSFSNTMPNYNLNSTPTHMQMGGPHQQQQQPHHHLHSGNPINYNQQVPPQQIAPSPLVQNNMSIEQQDNEKKDLSHDLNDISNSQMINESNLELFDFDDLDQLKMLLENDNAGTPSAQSSTLQSSQPPTVQIPPPQQQYHKMGSNQKQPPLPGQAPPFMHSNQTQGNLNESGSAQNQNPNIDPNLQQLIISQRSKPAYEMNPQIQPPFPNQAQQQQQPPQTQPNYQNKPYPPQQQQNLIPPPPVPHQIGNQSQMQPSHPQQYHGHQQQGHMQGQQWNQSNQQGNSQYIRNAPNQNKNPQYGMNNQNSNSYQKGMPNIPPTPHPGQMPNQQQNMNLQNYNNQNMGRQYSHNPQHNQNSNQSGANNMNRQPRYNNNNNQGYGGSQYNNNNPNNQNQQQQNYNKFQRGNQNAMNNNNNGNTPNKGGHGYQQHKNPFGSRQQAHYQRNNQPYTAHNPVPFQDPNTMDNQLMQQQQMQYHPQQNDNMGDLDQRDYS